MSNYDRFPATKIKGYEKKTQLFEDMMRSSMY